MFLADYAVYLHPKLLIVKVISFSLPKRKDLINVTHCISYFCKATRLSNHRSQKHLQSTDIILEVVQSINPCNPIIIIIDVGLGTQHGCIIAHSSPLQLQQGGEEREGRGHGGGGQESGPGSGPGADVLAWKRRSVAIL